MGSFYWPGLLSNIRAIVGGTRGRGASVEYETGHRVLRSSSSVWRGDAMLSGRNYSAGLLQQLFNLLNMVTLFKVQQYTHSRHIQRLT